MFPLEDLDILKAAGKGYRGITLDPGTQLVGFAVVYTADEGVIAKLSDGREITVIPCYGAGLWGPVWGYLAFADDAKTFVGAYFDHESETPGLGAKIKDDPAFRAQFVGKQADWAASPVFAIVKGGAAKASEIDAITGATMTSKGLGAAVDTWLEAYKPYFQKK